MLILLYFTFFAFFKIQNMTFYVFLLCLIHTFSRTMCAGGDTRERRPQRWRCAETAGDYDSGDGTETEQSADGGSETIEESSRKVRAETEGFGRRSGVGKERNDDKRRGGLSQEDATTDVLPRMFATLHPLLRRRRYIKTHLCIAFHLWDTYIDGKLKK